MSDHITLPRETVEQMRGELYALVRHADGDCGELDCEECEPLRPIRSAIAVLDAALKEPDTLAQAVEAEREACAKICDGYKEYGDPITNWAVDCAAAIRARGTE